MTFANFRRSRHQNAHFDEVGHLIRCKVGSEFDEAGQLSEASVGV